MEKIITQEDINRINDICEQYRIDNYTINLNGSIDVDGCVNLNYLSFKKLPLKFTSVSSDFFCSNNQLTSLEGCPTSVGGNFYCTRNKLTSLKFSPTSVSGGFYCAYNIFLPQHFTNLYYNLSFEEKKIFIKYQHDLRIWEDNYKEEEVQLLYEEIKDGMR